MSAGSNFARFFDPGFNRLGTSRHLLALAVLVDHAFVITRACIAAVLPVAALSWWLAESRWLRLKRP